MTTGGGGGRTRSRTAPADRPGGVRGPLGPGARIEDTGEARDLQGQHLVRAGDPGAAVDAHALGAGLRPQPGEPCGQLFGRKVAAVRVDVLRGRRGDGPGDMAADAVDRLHIAPVALGRPGVQQQTRPGEGGRPFRVQGRQGPRLRPEIALGGVRDLRGEVTGPGGEPAVQDPYVPVPGPAQQPPGAGRRPALPAVVHHDGGVLADPGPAHHGTEGLRVREGVAASVARRSGQLRVEVDEDRAGQMAGLVVGAAVRAAELPADVQEYRGPGSGRLARAFGCGDDGLHGCHPRAAGPAPVTASDGTAGGNPAVLRREPGRRGAAGAPPAPGGASICTGHADHVLTRGGSAVPFPRTATTTVRGERRR